MKKILILVATIIACAFLCLIVVKTEGHTSGNSFQGFVTYRSGAPAPYGTKVEVFQNGVKVREGEVQGTVGFYAVPDGLLPTGDYNLRADDFNGMLGYKDSHHEKAQTTNCDIVLDTAY